MSRRPLVTYRTTTRSRQPTDLSRHGECFQNLSKAELAAYHRRKSERSERRCPAMEATDDTPAILAGVPSPTSLQIFERDDPPVRFMAQHVEYLRVDTILDVVHGAVHK